MNQKENIIKLTGERNIVIQDSKGNITINQNDPKLLEKLQNLNNEQLVVLQQMVSEQSGRFIEQFKILLTGVATQKNIVKNSTINAETVRIGDNIEYHYHYNQTSKTKKQLGYIPVKPAVFIGRDKSPDEIRNLLTQTAVYCCL